MGVGVRIAAMRKMPKHPMSYRGYFSSAYDQEVLQDMQTVTAKLRPGYKSYLKSPAYRLEQFLDELEVERRIRN